MAEAWVPEPGQWVIYQPGHGPAEDGTITEVVSPTLVRVRYWGGPADAAAKATRLADLELGPGQR